MYRVCQFLRLNNGSKIEIKRPGVNNPVKYISSHFYTKYFILFLLLEDSKKYFDKKLTFGTLGKMSENK